MPYATTARLRRRAPSGLSLAGPALLGRLGDDFSWSDFGTSIAQSAAQGAASAGISLLKSAAAPKPVAPTAAAPAAATALTTSTVPVYVWAIGGMGLVLVLILAMRR